MENERQAISSATALLDTLADIAHNSGDVGHISADEMRNASSNADKALDALAAKAARTDALEAENAALVKERDALIGIAAKYIQTHELHDFTYQQRMVREHGAP